MTKMLDIAGKRFSFVIVESFSHWDKYKHSVWNCLCDCGERFKTNGTHLTQENTRSCGCFRQKLRTKHGQSWLDKRTKEYSSWQHMKTRVLNPKYNGWKNYGGRGIEICSRWVNSYENFISDMGKMPSPLHTLDRIDNNGNYEPSNCRWATRKEQRHNQRKKSEWKSQ